MSKTQNESTPQESSSPKFESQSPPQSTAGASAATPTPASIITSKLLPEAWHKQAAKFAVLLAMLALETLAGLTQLT